MRISCSQLLATSALFCLCTVLPPLPAKASLEEGIAAYNAKNYAGAVKLLTDAKRTNYSSAQLHYFLANSLVKLNSKSAAASEYRLALDLEPEGQLAEYCKAALTSLESTPVAAPQQTAKVQGTTKAAAAPVVEKRPGSQQPQVFVYLCGCPLCARVDSMITTLHAKYGNEINFIRTVKDATDSKTVSIVSNYKVTECPSVLLFDNHGRMTKQFSKVMPEELVVKEIAALAGSSTDLTRLSTTEDKSKIGTRNAIVNELEARIAADRSRVGNEIKMAEDAATAEVIQAAESRGRTPPTDRSILVAGARDRIRFLEDDFERRKREWYEDAERRLQALGIGSSSKEIKLPHPASD